jgi:hypothetical protein
MADSSGFHRRLLECPSRRTSGPAGAASGHTQEASPIRGDRDDIGLPAGYRADPLSEPGLVVVRGPDGVVVARFTLFADPEEVRRAAEQDESGLDAPRDD